MATDLKRTFARHLESQKEEIRKELDKKDECYFAIKLHWEPGEVLITLMMSDEEIEKEAKEAVSEVFEGRDVMDIFISRSREIVTFTII